MSAKASVLVFGFLAIVFIIGVGSWSIVMIDREQMVHENKQMLRGIRDKNANFQNTISNAVDALSCSRVLECWRMCYVKTQGSAP
ncbi:MAG: hypothetical protein WC505_05600 [Patescibacteria group bacterium]